MLRRLLILVAGCFQITALSAQDAPPSSFYTFGFSAGAIGWAATEIKPSDATFLRPNRSANTIVSRLEPPRNGKHLGIIANGSLGAYVGTSIQTNTKDIVSFLLKFSANRSSYSFQLPYSFVSNNKTIKNWYETDSYLAFLPSIQYSWLNQASKNKRYNRQTFLGLSAGFTVLHRNFSNDIGWHRYEEFGDGDVKMRTEYTSVNNTGFMFGAEIGERYNFSSSKRSLEFGISYYHSTQNAYSKSYNFYNKNQLIGGCMVDFKGSMVLLNVRYAFNYPKSKSHADSLVAIEKQKKPQYQISNLNGRTVDVQKVTTVRTAVVEIALWDDTEMDGDRISVYLNDKLILNNYVLVRTKKKMKIELAEGSNYLVIHAEHMGERPPAITAVRLMKNDIPRTKLLVSDDQESAAWKIIYKP